MLIKASCSALASSHILCPVWSKRIRWWKKQNVDLSCPIPVLGQLALFSRPPSYVGVFSLCLNFFPIHVELESQTLEKGRPDETITRGEFDSLHVLAQNIQRERTHGKNGKWRRRGSTISDIEMLPCRVKKWDWRKQGERKKTRRGPIAVECRWMQSKNEQVTDTKKK